MTLLIEVKKKKRKEKLRFAMFSEFIISISCSNMNMNFSSFHQNWVRHKLIRRINCHFILLIIKHIIHIIHENYKIMNTDHYFNIKRRKINDLENIDEKYNEVHWIINL